MKWLILFAIWAIMFVGCANLDTTAEIASPQTHVATSQPVKIANNGLLSLFDPIVRMFTRERNVTVTGNTAPVLIEQSSLAKYGALAVAVLMLLWLLPSGWPFRGRKETRIIVEFKESK